MILQFVLELFELNSHKKKEKKSKRIYINWSLNIYFYYNYIISLFLINSVKDASLILLKIILFMKKTDIKTKYIFKF